MKKFPPFLLACTGALALSVFCAATASAQLSAYAPFSSTAGTGALTGSTSGTGWSSGWQAASDGNGGTVNDDVVSPGYTYGMLQTTGNRAGTEAAQGFAAGALRTLTTPLSGNIWVSVLIQGSVAGGNNFFGLTLLSNNGSDPNQDGGIGLGQLYAGTTYGLFGDNVTGTNPVSAVSSTSLSFLVANFNTTTGAGTFYVNPTGLGTGTAPTGAAYTSTFAFNNFTNVYAVGLRGSTPAGYDEIRLGTTWASVSPTTVPEPGTYAMLSLGGLAGALVLRRRAARLA